MIRVYGIIRVLRLLLPQITAVDAAQLGFANLGLTISDTDLAWLYNLIAAAAAQPIQDAITREVAAQVRYELRV